MQTADVRYPTLQNGGIIAGPIQLLIAPLLPNDAANKAYVDGAVHGARARPVVYDIPADIAVPASGQWVDVTVLPGIPFTIPARPGVTSMIAVNLSCNLKGVENVGGVAVRIGTGQGASTTFPERRIFAFGPNATGDSSGFSVAFYSEPAPGATTMNIPIQVRSINIGSTPGSFIVAGGGPTVGDRSQIIITDLGPV
jgi:hypothetical protein